jgi:DNA-binding CsgD family transcriptional regulator
MNTSLNPASSTSDQSPQFTDIDKLCQFYIKNACFTVISLGNSLEIEDPDRLANSFNGNSFSMLGYFEFDQQYYAVIYVQDTLEQSSSPLTNLLTERELQIVKLVASGQSNKQVANQLHISEWTVSAHLRRIFIKLNVDSRTAMVYKCMAFINQRV